MHRLTARTIFYFFFNDTATTEIYTLSLHDALPISALLHQQRGNRHGVAVVGGSALEKLEGPQRPDVEVETVRFREQLARALAGDAEPPRLELRGADGGLRTDEG